MQRRLYASWMRGSPWRWLSRISEWASSARSRAALATCPGCARSSCTSARNASGVPTSASRLITPAHSSASSARSARSSASTPSPVVAWVPLMSDSGSPRIDPPEPDVDRRLAGIRHAHGMRPVSVSESRLTTPVQEQGLCRKCPISATPGPSGLTDTRRPGGRRAPRTDPPARGARRACPRLPPFRPRAPGSGPPSERSRTGVR